MDVHNTLGRQMRLKRIAPLLAMIEARFERQGRVRILDMGGTEDYWSLIPAEFLDAKNVEITIVNLPGGAKGVPTNRITHVLGDACDLAMYGDKEFDIAHSNSVLEHVGTWSRMVMFAKEVARVADQYFVQTPNYWFPIEPHFMVPFFHWLPEPTRMWILQRFTLGGRWKLKANSVDEAVRMVESARLLTKPMMKELFRDGDVYAERFFLLAKSWVAVRRTP